LSGDHLRIKRLALAAGLVLSRQLLRLASPHVPSRAPARESGRNGKADTGRGASAGWVSLLPLPAIALRQVRFANAAWGCSRGWRRPVGWTFRSTLWPCCRIGCVRQIALTDASVLIETDADGNDQVGVLRRLPEHARQRLDTAELDELTSRALSLSYRRRFKRTWSLRLAAFGVAASSASQPMRVRAEGAMDAKSHRSWHDRARLHH
jgi:hypothetical protein